MIEFFNLNSYEGVASLYANYLTLNRGLIPIIEDAYRVRVGLSESKKEIYIFKLNKDEALSPEFTGQTLFTVGITKTYARICSKPLMDFIFNKLDIKLEGKFIKANAVYDEVKRCIIIKVGDEL